MLRRRQFLLSASSMVMVSVWPGRARSAQGPPIARTVSVVDQRFGRNLPDPYRWMEKADDPDWMPFMRGQATYARARLDAMPDRARIARQIAKISGDLPVASKVQLAGSKSILEYRPAGAASFKLYAIEHPGAARRLLYDPEQETRDDGAHLSLDYWAASPDGGHLAFGTSPAGSEDSILRVLAIRDGSLLPDRIDRTQYARVAWLPDSSGFFFSRLHEGAVRGRADYYDNSAVWFHPIGGEARDDRRVVGGGDVVDGYRIAANEFPATITDPSSGWTLLQVSGAARRHNPLFVARTSDVRNGSAQWRAVLSLANEVTNVALRGDQLFYVSEHGAPNGRVLKLDLAAPGKLMEQLVAPQTEIPIEPSAHGALMVAARDGVYFVRTNGGPQTICRMSNDGAVAALPMPFEAGVHDLFADTREDGVTAGMAGWVQTFGLWRYAPDNGWSSDDRLNPHPKLDLSQYESRQIMARARDGARVPVSVVARRGLKRDGLAPCLARCYSAYGISATPAFNPRILALLESGGVFAQIHARGGGEFGSRWWKAGQKETKPNTWRDFVDGCQALFGAGITAPKRLTIMGGSAGGVAVGRALTERPDMFAGAIFNAAFTNPTRMEAEPTGATNYDEFGDPSIESDFKAIHEMDTYQHVRDREHYPAVLIMHGITDPRVAPWHSAKLAARLQRATASDHPVLLRVLFDAGHGAGSTRMQVDEQWADMIAFTLWNAAGNQ